MAETILAAHGDHVAGVQLIPGAGGIFEIEVAGRKVFTKGEAKRFPAPGEGAALVADAL